jgi:hypothetical protein
MKGWILIMILLPEGGNSGGKGMHNFLLTFGVSEMLTNHVTEDYNFIFPSGHISDIFHPL